MASTAVRFPVDKDPSQLSFWPDNDELAITGDTFFDQFLTFDTGDAPVLGGEVLEDPPSPSILLESLQNESVGSSDPFDLPPNGSLGETSTTGADQSIVDVLRTTENQTSPDSALFSALRGDPIPNSGSISDSELLHLEGISIRSSPHWGNVTEPSSPFASSAPLNPQQRSRFVESVYGTSRRTARRPKPVTEELYQPPIDMSDLDAFLADPSPGSSTQTELYGLP
ncbi:hypothetical protein NUW58_g10185 [Xylaria curta]|uniref:Uncharacterized protein n=1 Tax=Xylaria curta TaxID=42375 RepID=A0ACC1MNP0_9PEZI|nr:hypothetical protein NUW58_g10185 [Xylaria curta]